MWNQIYTSFGSFNYIKYLLKLKKYPFIGKYAFQAITRHLEF